MTLFTCKSSVVPVYFWKPLNTGHKPSLQSGNFATSRKHRDNFATAFAVAASVEDVGPFGMSKNPPGYTGILYNTL